MEGDDTARRYAAVRPASPAPRTVTWLGGVIRWTLSVVKESEFDAVNNGAPHRLDNLDKPPFRLLINPPIIQQSSSSMSDSEDDFMSDKFLVEPSTSSSSNHYSARRSAQQLKSLRTGQAKNQLSLKQEELVRRNEGLEKSLFDDFRAGQGAKRGESSGGESSGSKAMGMMMKMGWSVGEGLGRKRSWSPETRAKKAKGEDDEDEEVQNRGIGSRPGRTEPIRLSMWAGRKGLSARPPSPPPLPRSRNPDAITPAQEARLARETDGYREWQKRQYANKEVEKREWAAREKLVQFDREKGIKVGASWMCETETQFHPLHVMPGDPLGTLPRELLRLIYPAQAYTPSPSRSPSPGLPITEKEDKMTEAERVRQQLRREMLSDLPDDEDDGVDGEAFRTDTHGVKMQEEDYEGVDWDDQVAGTKRVLSMEVSCVTQLH